MTSSKTLIIAEAGVNHNGDINRAFDLIDIAAEAGADIVKFQSFRADKLASKNAPKADYQIKNSDQGTDESQYDMLKRLELSERDHAALIAHCKKRNIAFLSTPFDIDGLHMLVDKFGITTIKLGSSELTNGPILLAAAQTGHKVIFSTGMGSLNEIKEALNILAYGYLNKTPPSSRSDFQNMLNDAAALEVLREKVTVLHCNTAYPTPLEDVNLKAMRTISDTFGVPTGYSDHTMGIDIPLAAVVMGATVIEKHFTQDRTLPGPDHKASLQPDELKAMITAVREAERLIENNRNVELAEILKRPNIQKALGNGLKEPSASEKINAHMARKSIMAARHIPAGATLGANDIAIKRPASGASPMEYWDILNKIVDQTYETDQPLFIST
ncbi:MAG: N-acetylneuraminate synthase [Alphaproteobacteria bacterium]|nr:N-acetylneuraminate synthase [Alphaproteobacteria bacterium]|tara:strand:- start:20037 stop:21194 length:1158 start_codon:yes stop_codon:yes gene_type:complete